MLVYANEVYLSPGDDNLQKALGVLRRWLSYKMGPAFKGRRIEPMELKSFRQEKGEHFLSIAATPHDASDYCMTLEFRHADAEVDGRAWIVRIGMERTDANSKVRMTLVLETSEASPKVQAYNGLPTIPTVLREIFEKCSLERETPGMKPVKLTEEEVPRFLAEVNAPDRRHLVYVMAPCTRTGRFPVNFLEFPKRFAGLGRLWVIPDKKDASRLAKLLPAYHMAINGSLTCITPPRAGKAMGRMFDRDDIEGIGYDKGNFEDFLFGEVVHRMNVAIARRQVSRETVARRLTAAAFKKFRGETITLKEAEVLLKEVEARLADEILAREKLELDFAIEQERADELQTLLDAEKAKAATLAYRLDSKKTSTGEDRPSIPPPTAYEEIPDWVEKVAPGRLEFAGNARRTLKDCVYEDLPRVRDAFELLARDFVDAYCKRIPMTQAIGRAKELKVEYSANQSETTMAKFDGYTRTHTNGKTYKCSRHFCIGDSRNPVRCFRLYFDYDEDEKRVIVLHAGAHLENTKS